MDIITRVMAWLGDLAFAPLSIFSPVVALWIISALTGVAMLMIWRYTSNQDAIADVRRKIAAHLLATRLFKDNLSVTFRAQRQIIWQAIRLLGHSFRPMIIMLVPFVLIMVQIGLRYEHQSLAVGKKARVKVTLKEAAMDGGAAGRTEKGFSVQRAKWKGVGDRITLPAGVSNDGNDPCRAPALRTVDWRITAEKAGDYQLIFGSGQDRVEVPLRVGEGFKPISRIRGGGFFDRLLYSAEPSIPESSVFESIEIYYPVRSTPIFGLDLHWLITLLLLSIVFALIFKPFMKVHI